MAHFPMVIVSLMGVNMGCQPSNAGTSEVSGDVGNQEIRSLAEQYLYDTNLTDTEMAQLSQRLKRLTPEDSARFFVEIRALQVENDPAANADPRIPEIEDYVNTLALERNENRFLLPREILAQGLFENFGIVFDGQYTVPSKTEAGDIGVAAQAICIPPTVSCSSGTFQDTGLRYNACQSGCQVGSTFDRISNATCELLGCDFRVWYSSGAVRFNRVDGVTAAGNCIVNAWPSILNSYEGGYTKVLYGYNTATTICGIYTGAYLTNSTRGWKL